MSQDLSELSILQVNRARSRDKACDECLSCGSARLVVLHCDGERNVVVDAAIGDRESAGELGVHHFLPIQVSCMHRIRSESIRFLRVESI